MRKLPEATQQRGGLISPVHILFIICSVIFFIPHILCTLFPRILKTIRYRKHLIFKFKAYNTFNCFFFIHRPTGSVLLPFFRKSGSDDPLFLRFLRFRYKRISLLVFTIFRYNSVRVLPSVPAADPTEYTDGDTSPPLSDPGIHGHTGRPPHAFPSVDPGQKK